MDLSNSPARRFNGRSGAAYHATVANAKRSPKTHITCQSVRDSKKLWNSSNGHRNTLQNHNQQNNNNLMPASATNVPASAETAEELQTGNWMLSLCFRGQKVLRVPAASSIPPESVVFELSEH